MFKKLISLILSFTFITTQPIFAQGVAQLDMAQYLGSAPTDAIDRFRPLHMRYFSYDIEKDNFQLLLDKGDNQDIKEVELQEKTKVLMEYFQIGLALPNDKFWVNLRPDAQDQIIDLELEKTDLGKIMLESDLQLKKDTAQFTSPQTPEGRQYWDRLYKKAGELFGTESITIPTITRPWIVPGEIILRQGEDSAYIFKANMKVMLEEDYLTSRGGSRTAPTYQQYAFSDPRLKELNQYSTQLIRELIIPKLTKEVNTAKRYAALRQVFFSLVMARWFKDTFKGKPGQYAQLIDSHNLNNLTSKEAWSKITYFNEYKKSFEKGEYNLKEDIYIPSGQVIRSYVSGGARIMPQYNDITGYQAKETSASPMDSLDRMQMTITGVFLAFIVYMGTVIQIDKVRDDLKSVEKMIILQTPETTLQNQEYLILVTEALFPYSAIRAATREEGGSSFIFFTFDDRLSRLLKLKAEITSFAGGYKLTVFYDDTSDDTSKMVLKIIYDRVSEKPSEVWSPPYPEVDIKSILFALNKKSLNKKSGSSPLDLKQAKEKIQKAIDEFKNPFAEIELRFIEGKNMILPKQGWSPFARKMDLFSSVAEVVKNNQDKINHISLLMELVRGKASGDYGDIVNFIAGLKSVSSEWNLAIIGSEGDERLKEVRKIAKEGNKKVEKLYRELENIQQKIELGEGGLSVPLIIIPEVSDRPPPVTPSGVGGSDKASSSLNQVGGIDFRTMNYLVQPMGSFKDLRFMLPTLSLSVLQNIDLDQELESLRNMVKAGLVPSGARVKEYLAACFQKGKIEEKQDDLLVCLAEIYRLAEDENIETSPELRESLVIVDTGRFVLLPNSQKVGLN